MVIVYFMAGNSLPLMNLVDTFRLGDRHFSFIPTVLADLNGIIFSFFFSLLIYASIVTGRK